MIYINDFLKINLKVVYDLDVNVLNEEDLIKV